MQTSSVLCIKWGKRMTRQLICRIFLLGFCAALTGCMSLEDNKDNETTSQTSEQFESKSAESDNTGETKEKETYPDQNKYEKVKINTYKYDYSSECEAIMAEKYMHLDFHEGTVFNDIGNPEKLAVYSNPFVDISPEDCIEKMREWLKENGKTVDLENELIDVSGVHSIKDNENHYIRPKVYDYDDWETGSFFTFETGDCGIQMIGFDPYSLSTGVITKYLNHDKQSLLDVLGVYIDEWVEEGYVSDLAEKEYELINGKVKVKDAAEAVRKYQQKGVFQKLPEGVEIDVPTVSIAKITGTDKYCYVFNVRRVYYGVPVDHYYLGTSTPWNDDNLSGDIRYTYVADGQVDGFAGRTLAFPWERLSEETDEIISLKNAVEILDDYMAFNLSMEINRVELAYVMNDSWNDSTDEPKLYPCWSFRARSKTDDRYFRLYVNVITGDVYMICTKNYSL